MRIRVIALLCALGVQLLYGVNYSFVKTILAGAFMSSEALLACRIFGATLFFWIFAKLGSKETIAKKDYLVILAAAFFGVVLNMFFFIKGLEFTTPIHASVIMTITPIIVLILSSIFLKERITLLKVLGVALGFIGAIILTVYGKSPRVADNVVLGNVFVFINAVSYSIYLIILKSLTRKYHPFTFIKWLFLFGLIVLSPFLYKDFVSINYGAFNSYVWFCLFFIIIGATFLTYLLNPLALRQLKASTVSIFIYTQPVIAGVFALLLGNDILTSVKVVATLLIFLGVYLVTKKPKPKQVVTKKYS